MADTGAENTISGSSGACLQLADNQQWSVDGALNVSAVIWDDGELPSPGFVRTGAGTLTLSGNNSFSGPVTIDQGAVSVATVANQGVACNLGRGSLTLGGERPDLHRLQRFDQPRVRVVRGRWRHRRVKSRRVAGFRRRSDRRPGWTYQNR